MHSKPFILLLRVLSSCALLGMVLGIIPATSSISVGNVKLTSGSARAYHAIDLHIPLTICNTSSTSLVLASSKHCPLIG
jgi:hypothetical protein